MTNRKLGLFLALIVLVASVMACSVNLGTSEAPIAMPVEQVVDVPTAIPPVQAPPTAVPIQHGDIVSVLKQNGFQYQGPGDCNNLACTVYKYDNDSAVVNAIVSEGGFALSAPLTGGYDAGYEGTIIGKILSDAVNAGTIPYDVGHWIVSNMQYADTTPSITIQGYSIEISMFSNSNGIYFVNEVVVYPSY